MIEPREQLQLKQLDCPKCGAPLWEGGRCPWDLGSGCVGRSLTVPKPRKRPETAAAPKVAPVPTPKAPVAARRRRERLAPEEARRRKIARSAAYNAAHRQPVIARCVYDHKIIPVTHGGPARKYCSDRCRGRAERASAA
jgi:hypothetical protein